jgi:penicillin G amidase
MCRPCCLLLSAALHLIRRAEWKADPLGRESTGKGAIRVNWRHLCVRTIASLTIVVAATGALPRTSLSAPGSGAALPVTQTLTIPGLDGPVAVVFESNGIPHIQASTDHDYWVTVGYLHATFRMFQMDIQRRLGEGQLSEVAGSRALSSDQFELRLGLIRSAQAEWDRLPANDPAKTMLTEYAQGVNQRMTEDKRDGTLSVFFRLVGNYQPKPWTPLDSIVVYKVLTQNLSFDTRSLDLATLAATIGAKRLTEWFPVVPHNVQRPYDLGPYHKHSSSPPPPPPPVNAREALAAAQISREIASLPYHLVHTFGNSNNWAITGPKTAAGKAFMAGDPHLSLTLPSVWFQYASDSPSFHLSGISFPGLPFIIIGHNQHISWTETNGENQQSFYYLEQTDAAHPGQYFYQGAWRPMGKASYDIAVQGASSVHLDVDLTAHGPILPDSSGQVISVDWTGNWTSNALDAVLGIERASNWRQFHAALKGWGAPTQNFAYADDHGNIGVISAGYWPQVKKGSPWLPMPGTGAYDISGTIPYSDVPLSYDPPSHFVFSANQRQVTSRYPYYVSTSAWFDNGYRADRIYQVLSHGKQLKLADMERLQTDIHDYLAGRIVPALVKTLASQKVLTPMETQARSLLAKWTYSMDETSSAAAIWWLFWRQYERDVFSPWLTGMSSGVIDVAVTSPMIDEDLETWTLGDPRNGNFARDGGSAGAGMVRAFKEAVASLSSRIPGGPAGWQWGKLHTLELDSLIGGTSLGYGPKPIGGDQWTVSSRHGDDFHSTAGPSWRMIVDWGAKSAVAVYPGGQSEDFRSAWFQNFVQTWWDNKYNPMLNLSAAESTQGIVTWTLKS